jgi:beta-glucosidase
MGWEIYPEGIRKILKGIKKHHLDQYPILITENGLADRDDKKRSDFIYKHLKVFLETCYELGLKPMGYLYWSLLDNFEWIDGYYPRFGLFEIEYSSQDRRPRNSAHYFREMGRIHSLVPPDGFKAF